MADIIHLTFSVTPQSQNGWSERRRPSPAEETASCQDADKTERQKEDMFIQWRLPSHPQCNRRQCSHHDRSSVSHSIIVFHRCTNLSWYSHLILGFNTCSSPATKMVSGTLWHLQVKSWGLSVKYDCGFYTCTAVLQCEAQLRVCLFSCLFLSDRERFIFRRRRLWLYLSLMRDVMNQSGV